MCRDCETTGSLLADSSVTELPSGISMKGWKEVTKYLGAKGNTQLREFYEKYGMDVIQFDMEYRSLQSERKHRPILSTLVADFYATEYIMAYLGTPQLDLPLKVIYELFGGGDTTAYMELLEESVIPEGSDLGADLVRTLAWMRQVEIIQLLDEPLQNYFALVIGGELRWHPFISQKFFDGDMDMLRDVAWQSWLPWVKRQPPTAYYFFEKCFREFFPSEPYGGEGWANAAIVLRQRLMHEFSPDSMTNAKLWLDRAFSCEHNNGCIFDKLYNAELLPCVLDAHHESDIIMLSDYASHFVQSLVNVMEQSRLARA